MYVFFYTAFIILSYKLQDQGLTHHCISSRHVLQADGIPHLLLLLLVVTFVVGEQKLSTQFCMYNTFFFSRIRLHGLHVNLFAAWWIIM